jgi:hypothetical protein
MRRHPKKSLKMLSKSSAGSEEGDQNAMKKPLIAKWKAGAKLQVTSRAQNDGESSADEAFASSLKFRFIFPQNLCSKV